MTIQTKPLPDTLSFAPATRPGRKNLTLEALHLGLKLYARLSPDGAGKWVNTRFFTPRRLPMPSRFEYLLDKADSHTQLQHGAHIVPVYSWGDGPVILGVHGWSGAGIQFGAFVEPLVVAGYRVVLFDAPAHGRAQGTRTDLYEIADVIGKIGRSIGPIHGIIAHSMGCLAAARALDHGLEAKRLVMLAPPADLSSVVNGLGRQLRIPASVLSNHRARMEQQFGESVWEELALTSLVARLPQRGLVVIDSDDREVPPHQSERVYREWPGAHVLRTNGHGHHRILWKPEVTETVISTLTSPA